MKTSNRGAVSVVVVLLYALGAFGLWQAKTLFAPSKPTKQVVQLDESAEKARQAAVEAQKKAEEAQRLSDVATKAADAALVAEKAKGKAAAGFIAGADAALQAEANPSRPVQVAKTLVSDAGRTLDPLSAEERIYWQKQVAGLLSENEAIRSKAEADRQAKEAQIATLRQDSATKDALKAAAEAEASAARAQLTAQTAKVTELTGVTAQQSERLKDWATDTVSWMDRFKALIALIVLIGGVAAYFYIKKNGFEQTAKNLQSMAVEVQKKTRDEVRVLLKDKPVQEVEASVAALAASIKTHEESWMSNASKSEQKTLEAVKAKLNLV